MKLITTVLLVIIASIGHTLGQNPFSIKEYIPEKDIDTLTYEPPSYFIATVENGDVTLNWLPPGDGLGEWWSYSDSTLFSFIGLSAGGEWKASARWESDQLEGYNGEYITKVGFVPGSEVCDYTIVIYSGENAANILYSQPVNNFEINVWNDIILDQAVLIDATQELWVGISVDNVAAEFPMGVDIGPAVNWYGDLVSFSEGEWMTAYDYGLDYNWLIRTYITNTNKTSSSVISTLDNKTSQKQFQNDPTGYNLYRDDVILTSSPITGLEYIETGIPTGIYNYKLTAVYDTIESDPAELDVQVGGPILEINPEEITEVILTGETTNSQISLKNNGDSELLWTLEEDVEWLSFSSIEGQIASGDSIILEVYIDATNISAGNYSEETKFTINNLTNTNYYLTVNLTVGGYPVIEMELDSLNFGDISVGTTSTRQFTISNTGSEILYVSDVVSSDST
ncbi:MAG: hypothetical protein C0598_07050, partial [Marinilabiliales bacterium]